MGIDTTAEIVPDTLHLVIPASIASDTTYARTCLNQAKELIKAGKYDDAYAKADTAKHIYQMNIGYVSKEVADCLLQMGRVKGIINSFEIGINYIKISIKINIKINGFINIQIGDAFYSIGIIYNKKGKNEIIVRGTNLALFCSTDCFNSTDSEPLTDAVVSGGSDCGTGFT